MKFSEEQREKIGVLLGLITPHVNDFIREIESILSDTIKPYPSYGDSVAGDRAEMTQSRTVGDEEIEKAAKDWFNKGGEYYGFIIGAKWALSRQPSIVLPKYPFKTYLELGYDERGGVISAERLSVMRTESRAWNNCIERIKEFNGLK